MTIAKVASLVSTNVPRLYVDALNFTTRFFPHGDFHCGRAHSRVKRFVDAATNNGTVLKTFFKEASHDASSHRAWRGKRSSEVSVGKKDVPQGTSVLLGDMFRDCGVEVCYSLERDNAETLALHALADEAAILSMSEKVVKFVDTKCTVFDNFTVEGRGKLLLSRHPLQSATQTSTTRYHQPPQLPPAVASRVTHMVGDTYRRGVPSPLVRALGHNLHGVVAPLRQALYHKQGKIDPVAEEWPEWSTNDNQVKWVERKAVPLNDPRLLDLLNKPHEAMQRFFPFESASPDTPPAGRGISRSDWRKHVLCARSVVYELCVMSNPDGPSLLDLMLEHEQASVRRHTKAKCEQESQSNNTPVYMQQNFTTSGPFW